MLWQLPEYHHHISSFFHSIQATPISLRFISIFNGGAWDHFKTQKAHNLRPPKPPTSQKHSSKWSGNSKLPLCVNVCVHGVLWWTSNLDRALREDEWCTVQNLVNELSTRCHITREINKKETVPSGNAMEKSLYTTKWNSHWAGQMEEKLISGPLKHFRKWNWSLEPNFMERKTSLFFGL